MKLLNRDVIHVLAQKVSRFHAEFCHVGSRLHTLQHNLAGGADFILKIRIDDRSLFPVDQFDEIAKALSRRLQHWSRHVLPVFIGLDFEDERVLGRDRGEPSEVREY